ncbi:MAG: hypothetical protein RL011_1977 [Pseudomonadota bacterium]
MSRRWLWRMAFAGPLLLVGALWVGKERWYRLYDRLLVTLYLPKISSSAVLPDGVVRYYKVEVGSKASMNKSGDEARRDSNQPDIEVKLAGRIAFEREPSLGKSAVRIRFAMAPTLSLRQASEPSDFPPDSATISTLIIGVSFQLGEHGQLAYANESAVGDRFAIQLLRQVAAGLQVCLSEKGSSTSWACEEQDGTGSYQANYEVTAISGHTELRKVKTGYLALQAVNDGMSPPPLKGKLNGESTIQLNPNSGLPQIINGQEVALVTILVDGGEIRSNAQTDFRIEFESEEVAPPNSIGSNSRAASSGGEELSDRGGLDSTVDNLRRASQDRFGDDSATNLLRAFESARQSDSSTRPQAERDVYDRMVGYVRLHDKDLGDILKTLSGRKADDPWLQQVLSAFAYVGCKECQTQLVNEVMARESDPAFASDLLSLLSQPEQPGVEIEKALRMLTDSSQTIIHDMAELALGTVGHRLRQFDQPRSLAIQLQYLDKFRQSSDIPTQMRALSVLGNIGNEGLTQELKPWLQSGDDSRREAAARALRNVESEGAQRVLIPLLADDAVRVRRAVVESLSQMRKSEIAVTALSERFRSEKVPLVRQVIVQDLARYLRDSTKVQEILREAAKNDTDADVRLMAANSLIMYGIN